MSLPITDLGMAERLIASPAGKRLRYVYDWGRWISWTGERWVTDSGQAVDAMTEIAREVVLDALDRDEPSELRAALRQEQASRIRGALDLAAADRTVVVRAEALDADPFVLSTPSGVVDLRTGTLRAHDPADLLTKTTGVHVDLDGEAPRFTKYLAEVLPDESKRDWIQRLVGAALICVAGPREHVVAFLTGTGANGKSVLVGVLLHVLGDYAHTASSRLLLDRGQEDHPTLVADLHGRRLVVVSELPAGGTWNEERLKWLSGGDRLTARRMREDFWSFAPTHSLVVVANHEPRSRDDSTAFWRRMRLVRFGESFLGREDRALPAALEAEAPAILGWCVRGALAYQARGLDAPDAVSVDTAAYREREDSVGRFLDAHAEPVSYGVYQAWCEAEGDRPIAGKRFAAELTRRGYEQRRTVTGARLWSQSRQQGLQETPRTDTTDSSSPISAYARAGSAHTGSGVGAVVLSEREPGDDDDEDLFGGLQS